MIKSTTNDTMTVTLTTNYKEVLHPQTLAHIDEHLEDNYCLEDMLIFIDEYNEDAFCNHYEEYVRCGEAIGYEAVDALAAESGIDYIDGCDERYRGCYQSTADFAEEFVSDTMGYDIPDILVVDWEAVWDRNLYYDFTACNDGGTYCPIHIFSDH